MRNLPRCSHELTSLEEKCLPKTKFQNFKAVILSKMDILSFENMKTDIIQLKILKRTSFSSENLKHTHSSTTQVKP